MDWVSEPLNDVCSLCTNPAGTCPYCARLYCQPHYITHAWSHIEEIRRAKCEDRAKQEEVSNE